MKAGPEKTADDPRLAAFQILCDVERGEFADRAASRRLAGLPAGDRGLAMELAYGSIRLRSRLDAELAVLLDRPLGRVESGVLQWLRLGLYQVRETRVPDHAAVDQTVRGIKRTVGPKASGLANAVLRRAVREGVPVGAFPDPELDPESVPRDVGLTPSLADPAVAVALVACFGSSAGGE